MPLTKNELIAMLKQLIGVEITVDVTKGGVTLKKAVGPETFQIVEVDGSLVTVQHVVTGKESIYFVDIITVEIPPLP